MERFAETWKRKEQDENDTGDKNKAESLVQSGFRSEDLQE